MNLKAIKFCRFQDKPNEWGIEGNSDNSDNSDSNWVTFENINLIVGKNATGKSKTVDVIRHIADLFSGDSKTSDLKSIGYGTANYNILFADKTEKLEYSLKFENGIIIQEVLLVNGIEKLNRKKGELWYEGVNETLEFQIDDDILAITKRDKKQHSFFEKLYSWGANLNHYRFGGQLGKNALLSDLESITDDHRVDLKTGDKVSEIFVKGIRKFSDEFSYIMIEDMKDISYDIKKIQTSIIKTLPFPVYGLNVKESDLDDITDQKEMSQGMFRSLSLLIQLNYALLNNLSSCILIDDIGEGLDYDRSKKLIDLIIKKVENSSVQVIMTSNNRFVMNSIPLKYWMAIQRKSKKSVFYNYKNSKKVFDDYKYTGLNNFDFLSSEFYISGFETTNDK